MADLAGLSLTEVSARIAAREVSPVEVVDAVLARISAADPTLNAYLEVHAETSRAAADAAERAIAAGYHIGPLHGVPLALKDNVATARRAVPRAGSRVLRDNVAGGRRHDRRTGCAPPGRC